MADVGAASSVRDPIWTTFGFRLAVLLAVMVVIAALELGSGSKDARTSGIGWLYTIAVYAICLIMFPYGGSASRAASYAIAALLIVAVGQTVWEILKDVRTRGPYPLPKLDFDDALTLAVSVAAAASLARFRSVANPVIAAAVAMSAVDVLTNAENIATSFILNWLGNPRLSFLSDVFDVVITLVAAIIIIRQAQAASAEPAPA